MHLEYEGGEVVWSRTLTIYFNLQCTKWSVLVGDHYQHPLHTSRLGWYVYIIIIIIITSFLIEWNVFSV